MRKTQARLIATRSLAVTIIGSIVLKRMKAMVCIVPSSSSCMVPVFVAQT